MQKVPNISGFRRVASHGDTEGRGMFAFEEFFSWADVSGAATMHFATLPDRSVLQGDLWSFSTR